MKQDRDWAIGAVVGGGVASALFLLRSKQQLGDSLVYLSSVVTGENFFHPHHLLYNPSLLVTRTMTSWMEPIHDELFAAQAHNVFWAGIAAAALFVLIRRLTGHIVLGLLGALLLAASNMYWELATQSTVYSPAAAVPLFLAATLAKVEHERMSLRRALVVSGILSLAVLYHQANVLLSLPIAWYVAVKTPGRGMRLASLILLTAGLVTAAAYEAAALASHSGSSLREFVRFCTAYTNEICWGPECVPSANYWGSADNMILGGANMLSLSLLENVIALPDGPAAIAAPFLGVLMLALCLYHVARVLRRFEPSRVFLLAWFGVYVGFYWWWMPSYSHGLYLAVAPLIVLGSLGARDVLQSSILYRRWTRLAAAACSLMLIAAIAGVNLYLRVIPRHSQNSDSYAEAEDLVAISQESVEYYASYRVWNHLRYYFGAYDGARLGKYPLIHLYNEAELPQLYDRDVLRVFDANLLRPDYRVLGYSPDGEDAYSAPQQWLRLLEWLLAIERNSAGRIVASRSFHSTQVGDGRVYLVVGLERQPIDGLADLLEKLDDATNGVGGSKRPYAGWLQSRHGHPQTLELLQ